MTELRDAAMTSKAWPFEEARRLLKRYENGPPAKGHVLFETGYGPSGLPHIGTFGEVLRTTMIRRAFEVISDIPTRLICFSDDMDGMRKVPGNVPNQEMLREHLQKPLTSVPDPFGEFESFGHHNNAMLRRFLDTFGFDYEFYSATDFYASGQFDEILLRAAERYDALMKVMLKSLRRGTAADLFGLPAVASRDGARALRADQACRCEGRDRHLRRRDGREWTVPVTGGKCKLQWKPDFGARWAALGVDFEMYGKDHSTNTPIYDAICEILGAPAARAFHLRAVPRRERAEDLQVFRQRHLHRRMAELRRDREPVLFHVPEAQDGEAALFRRDPEGGGRVSPAAARLCRPGRGAEARESGVPHPRPQRARLQHGGELRDAAEPRLRRPCGRQGRALGLHPPLRARGVARNPSRSRRGGRFRGALLQRFREAHQGLPRPTDQERAAMEELSACLGDADKALDVIARKNAQEGKDMALPEVDWHDDEFLQSIVFAIGKTHGFEPLRAWFSALYEVLMGASQGPRFGGFIALYGIEETRALIADGLAGRLTTD
jgi:lysyl-tRNA synthetase class 1